VREVARRGENGNLEVTLDLPKTTKFLDRRKRSLLAPNEQRRLT
jgi:hypothetical protein